MQEVWKDIPEYEGLYQVSNKGRVRSLDHETFNGKYVCNYKGKERIQSVAHGYYAVTLCKRGVQHFHFVHRLVASAFLPNPQKLPDVNHIDANKLNNCVSNLEWCTPLENNRHACKLGLVPIRYGKDHPNARRIFQYSIDGVFIKTWYGIDEISRELGITRGNIDKCLRGTRNKAGGFQWKLG